MLRLNSFVKYLVSYRGGIKLEFVRHLFDSIQKFAVRLIQKGQKIFEKFDEN